MVKTNAMRILDRACVKYGVREYEHGEGFVDGATVAERIGRDPSEVFKTIVTVSASRRYYVVVVPVCREIDLKAAARVFGEKNLEPIKVGDITKVTGYVRGGCSPIGMKKRYATAIDESCLGHEIILVSGGSIGTQIECAPRDLIAVTEAVTAAVTRTGE